MFQGRRREEEKKMREKGKKKKKGGREKEREKKSLKFKDNERLGAFLIHLQLAYTKTAS